MTDQAPAACPTPETHNWGCGCPTDQMPASRLAEAVSILHDAMDNGVKDPVIRQKLIGQLVGACHHAAELRAAVEQSAEAHPPRETWRVKVWDVDEWMPAGVSSSHRESGLNRLTVRRSANPDDKFRLVRETTTWTVEETG
ncbi:hypothetical protein [Streptomyces sp. NBC_01353]|uniref:hypothetical protein n=1 Tax=Streptomyces sp. NBC_01353 TaxID=2903835 RepID=UPI002E3128D3|nr:hypothetical protein [Streptomyces sp. NBC_01353]